MSDIKDLVQHLERIETLPELPRGTFVLFQMKDGLDPEVQMELSQALFDMLEDTELRLLIVPGILVERLAVLGLDDLRSIRDAIDRAIAERHLVQAVMEA